MKKIITLVLLTCICLLCVTSCAKADKNKIAVNYYTNEGVGYFLGDGGALVVKDGVATVAEYEKDGANIKIDGKTLTAEDLTKASFTAPSGGDEFYNFETVSGKKHISSLKDAGKNAKILFVPKDVYGIKSGAFEGACAANLFIGKTNHQINLSNGAFSGTSLNIYIDGSIAPTELLCGNSLLEGSSSVQFFIGSDAIENFKSDYTWGNFSSNMKEY